MIPRVNTPWGWSDTLRDFRLRPGPGQPAELVSANQRERMYAAAVAAVSEHGFRDTRVADIVRISGVSRSAFYKHFDDKADCCRATAKAIWEQAYEIPEFGVATTADAGRWADRFPECALFVLTAPTGLGSDSRDREIKTWSNVFSRKHGTTPLVSRAVIAGALQLTADKLNAGDSAERFAGEFTSLFVNAYGRDDISVARARRKLAPALAAVPTAPGDRIMAATRDLLHENAGEPPTIIEIAERAKASLSTFYDRFRGLDDLTHVLEGSAYRSAATSAEDGVEAWLRWLASNPGSARLAILHRPHCQHVPLRLTCGLNSMEQSVADAVVTALLVHEIESGRCDQVHRLAPLVETLLAAPASNREAVAA